MQLLYFMLPISLCAEVQTKSVMSLAGTGVSALFKIPCCWEYRGSKNLY